MDEELLTCPYCGREQYTHEPDDISAFMCLTTCEHCGKEFWYSVTVTREYESRRDSENDQHNCEEEGDDTDGLL